MDVNREIDPADGASPDDGGRGRGALLAMAPEEFRRVGRELVDAIAEFLASVPDRPVTPDESPEEVRRLLGAHLGPQNSRGFRALNVWLALRQVGGEGYLHTIGEHIRLSERLHARVDAHPELEAHTQALSINTLRFVPADLAPGVGREDTEAYLDTLNRALLERIQASGEAFVSNAVVGGRYLLRPCIVNFHTGAADVDALPEIVARLGREVDAALRGVAASA